MGKKKIEKDLRDAGLRKKRARTVANAADRARSGDRAARALVDRHTAALRASLTAVVRHAKPPKSKSAPKTSKRTRSAKNASNKSTSTTRTSASRSTSKSTVRRHPRTKPATK
jgi:hypothetical protein